MSGTSPINKMKSRWKHLPTWFLTWDSEPKTGPKINQKMIKGIKKVEVFLKSYADFFLSFLWNVGLLYPSSNHLSSSLELRIDRWSAVGSQPDLVTSAKDNNNF